MKSYINDFQRITLAQSGTEKGRYKKLCPWFRNLIHTDETLLIPFPLFKLSTCLILPLPVGHCPPLSMLSFILIFFFFWLHPVACEILVPNQGLNPCPLHWEYGPAGKSPCYLFYSISSDRKLSHLSHDMVNWILEPQIWTPISTLPFPSCMNWGWLLNLSVPQFLGLLFPKYVIRNK